MTESLSNPRVHTERVVLRDDDEPGRRIGLRIDRWAEDDGPCPVVLLVHGFKGFMDWGFFPYVSHRFAAAGFVAVSVNTSGCGIGDDPFTLDDDEAFRRDSYTRELQDIARARAFARALDDVDADREILFGHSRGGGMALISASEAPPSAVVTWSAIDDVDRFGEDVKQRWRDDGELCVPNARTGQVHRMGLATLDDIETNRDRLDILAAASRLDVPLLALHGTADATVEPEAVHRIAERARAGEAFLIDGADHAMGAGHPLHSPEDIRTLQVAIDATLAFAVRHVLQS
ncbi:MAG: alpha/beta fold hydrolase [Planctomycetota bacterium]